MNILVDGRAFVKTAAGISTFLRCSLEEWAKQKKDDTFYLFLPREKDNTVDLRAMPDNVIPVVITSKWLTILPNLLLLFLCVPFLVRRFNIGLFYTPVPCIPFFLPHNIKTLIVVHDVVNLQFSSTMELRNKIATKLTFVRSIRQADYIWTNSEYTRKEVEAYIPEKKCKSIFVGCAVDRNFYYNLDLSEGQKEENRKRLGIESSFFLFVGSLEPRKNLEFLLRIMPEVYKRTGFILVVVGGRGWKSSYINEIVSQLDYPAEAVKFMGYVTNDDLTILYNIAHCFVSSSKNEGFGMPQLEAMLCGCPIITSHNSAMIEVAEGVEGAKTVSGYNEKEWIEIMVDAAGCKKHIDTMCLDRYDWHVIVDNLIKKLYDE